MDMDIAKYRRQIIGKMKSVGTYNASFAYTIDVLARTMCDYDNATQKYDDSKMGIVIKHTNKAGATNIVKNPIYASIEKLRDDVVSYSRELGLTPAGLKRINEDKMKSGDKTKSKLEELMMKLP